MTYNLYLIKLSNEDEFSDDIIDRDKLGYSENMTQEEIYDSIRGYWRISEKSFEEADFFLGLAPEDESGRLFRIVMEIQPYNNSLTTVDEDESNNSGGEIKTDTKYFEGDITNETNLVGRVVQFNKPSQNRRLKMTSDELEQFIVENWFYQGRWDEVQQVNGNLFSIKKDQSIEDEITNFFKNGGKYTEPEVNFGKSVGREIWALS